MDIIRILNYIDYKYIKINLQLHSDYIKKYIWDNLIQKH